MKNKKLNEEISHMRILMKKLLNENFRKFHIRDQMEEEFGEIFHELILNKLNVTEKDIFGDFEKNVYNKDGQLIKNEPIRNLEKAEEYENIYENFNISELVDICYQKIKDEYNDSDYSIDYIPDEIEDFAVSKMKEYLDSLYNNEEQ